MIAHEVLSRQDRVLLDPDDGLGEIQSTGFEHRRVVSAVGVSSPNVEGPTREKHAGHVAEPGIQELIELLFSDEIVR